MYPLLLGLMVFDVGYDVRIADVSDRFSLVHQTRFYEGERYISDGVSAAYDFHLTNRSKVFVGGNLSLEQHQYSKYFHDKYITLSPISSLNTLKCNFAVYDVAGVANVCWNNIDKNASDVSIDSECDRANDLSNPSNNCSCAFD